MTIVIPPFLHAILAEANSIAPNRRRTSDGTLGDAAHRAEVSDHNPAPGTGIVHACDISQSVVGNPYGAGTPPGNLFDAHAYGDLVAQRMIAGTETRVKYLVSHNYKTGRAKIMNLAVAPYWRDQSGDTHISHLHVSINYNAAAENSTAPFFRATSAPAPPEDELTDAEKTALVNETAARVLALLWRDDPNHPGQHLGALAEAFKTYK